MDLTARIAMILAAGAVVMDGQRTAVDNLWTLFWTLLHLLLFVLPAGPSAWRSAVFGAILPFLLLFPFFCFRMIGAGDIKLLMALGSMTGPTGCLTILLLTFLLAAIFAISHFLRHHDLKERMQYFADYVQDYLQTGERRPYLRPGVQTENLHMTIPIFFATVLFFSFS